MKFGAVLRDSAAELPDAKDLFIKYKQLKKSLKRMQSCAAQGTGHPGHLNASGDDGICQTSGSETSAGEQPKAKRTRHDASLKAPHPAHGELEAGPSHHHDRQSFPKTDKDGGAPILLDPELEAEFLRVITADVMELNDRYIEKEEDNVIKFEQLEDEAQAATSHDAQVAAYTSFVNLHGELLMLFHWSVLAYTGLVKILKKHRKRTGAPLHAPHLENLLSQPFCSVEVTCEMVRKAEEWVAKLANELSIAPPPPVPLPGDLFVGSAGGDGSEGFTSPHSQKAKVLEAVAAAVEAAEAAEVDHSEEGGQEREGIVPGNEEEEEEEQTRRKFSTGGEQTKNQGRESTAVVVGGTGAVQGGMNGIPVGGSDNKATRRIRAALNVWQQLQSNVSTPSTLIAPGAAQQQHGAVVVPGLVTHPSNLTNSSVA